MLRADDNWMQMLFTWDTSNLCIIFHWWRITGLFSLLVSLAAVAALTAGYELVREASRRYEASSVEYANSLPSMSTSFPLLAPSPGHLEAGRYSAW